MLSNKKQLLINSQLRPVHCSRKCKVTWEQSVNHFDPDCNIPTTVGLIAIKFGIYIHVPFRMNCNKLCDSLHPPVPHSLINSLSTYTSFIHPRQLCPFWHDTPDFCSALSNACFLNFPLFDLFTSTSCLFPSLDQKLGPSLFPFVCFCF